MRRKKAGAPPFLPVRKQIQVLQRKLQIHHRNQFSGGKATTIGEQCSLCQIVGDSLVVVDDKAHIWEEATITGILANAKAMSELSGYAIIIIAANGTLEMTSQEFVNDYYDHVLTSNEDESELIADGYIFLINLADREYYLSAYGKAMDVYTDTVRDELFDEIQQFLVDENHEAAVKKVIENAIY